MRDLENVLRTLGDSEVDTFPSPDVMRTIAARRRRRRTVRLAVLVPLLTASAALAAYQMSPRPSPQVLTSDPGDRSSTPTYADDQAEPQNQSPPTPSLTVTPPADVDDGQLVAVRADGLRPDTPYTVTSCWSGSEADCDLFQATTASTDASGRLELQTRVWASLYGPNGRVDCTVETCTVTVRTADGTSGVEATTPFAAEVTAAEPRLFLEPSGPHRDGDRLTVRGTGFRPGLTLGNQIRQCPSAGGPCGRAADAVTVNDSGAFSTTVRFAESLPHSGSCRRGPGCQIEWRVDGTTLADVPLEIR